MGLTTVADTNRIGKHTGCAPYLYEMLRRWMAKEGVGLRFTWCNERFVTLDRWFELEEEMWVDGWDSS